MQSRALTSADALAIYRTEGYVTVADLVSAEAIDRLGATLAQTAGKYLKDTPPGSSDEPWPEVLDHQLVELRASAPTKFSALYDSMQLSLALQQMMLGESVARMAAKLMGDAPEGLAATGHMLRMDPPHDVRNVLDWHQEINYYEQNLDPSDGIVVWIPMRTVRPEDGSMRVCPGSHLIGRFAPESVPKADYMTSAQQRVPKHILDQFVPEQVLANRGDVVFFHMSLIHSSGHNTSDRIRYSATVRLHRMLTPDFLPGRLLYLPNQYVKEERAKLRTVPPQ